MTCKSTLAVIAILFSAIALQSCGDDDSNGGYIAPDEDPSTFARITDITIGGEGAAEIAAFDPITDQLFVVNNADDSKIDVVNFAIPSAMSVNTSIIVNSYGGGVNSVAVNGAFLAAAIEAETATDNGQVVVFNIADLSEAAVITVGSLPD